MTVRIGGGPAGWGTSGGNDLCPGTISNIVYLRDGHFLTAIGHDHRTRQAGLPPRAFCIFGNLRMVSSSPQLNNAINLRLVLESIKLRRLVYFSTEKWQALA